MAGDAYNKAFFTNIDTKAIFRVQFNPKEFKLDEKASWKASEEQEATKPLLTYEKGEPTTVSMDLVFDSTDTGKNVYDSYVIPLRDFLTSDVSVEVKAKKAGDPPKKTQRPPFCKFTWGTFEFDCVIEKVSCTFLMFKPDGTPLRAKVNVGLKETKRSKTNNVVDNVTLTAHGSIVSGAATNAKTYTTGPGDTTTSIAHKFGADPSDIALANNLATVYDIKPGTHLVIPGNSELAHVLARQNLRHTPAYWKNDRKIDPFEHREVKGGDTRYVPSAFEDEGPVALDYEVEPGSLAASYKSFGGSGPGKNTFTFGTSGEGAEYGEHAESDFSFGQTKPQAYGGHKDSGLADSSGDGIDAAAFGESDEAGGTAGQGIGAGEAGSSSGATDVRNTATPDDEGPATKGQEMGGQRESDEAGGTSGKGIGEGEAGDSAEATSFRNTATPDGEGPATKGQEMGGQRESDEAGGTSGKGTGAGAAGSSTEATSFRDTATPDGEGPATKGQEMGGQGDSEAAGGTSGQGAGAAGAAGSSSSATEVRNTATPDGEGPATKGQEMGGQGDSEAAGGTSGQGASAAGATASASATAVVDKATPISGGAQSQGEAYGGQGPSDLASPQAGSGGAGATMTPGEAAGTVSGQGGGQGSAGGQGGGKGDSGASEAGTSSAQNPNVAAGAGVGAGSTGRTASVQEVLRGATTSRTASSGAETAASSAPSVSGAGTAAASPGPVTPAAAPGGPTLSAADVLEKGRDAAKKGTDGDKG